MMRKREMGFSYIVSPGNELAIGFEDYLEWLIDDPETTVVGAYLETLRRPERLRELGVRAEETGTSDRRHEGRSDGLRGRRPAGPTPRRLPRTTPSSTPLLRQSGIVRVDDLNELAEAMSIALSPRFRRAGWRLGVLSGSGGECSHVSDVATGEGFEMPPLAESTTTALDAVLPDFSVRRNPLDGGGAGLYEDPTVLPAMLDIVLADPSFDTLAVTLGLDSRDWMVEALAEGVLRSERFVFAYNSMITGVVDAAMVGKLRAAGHPVRRGNRDRRSAHWPSCCGARRRPAHQQVWDASDTPRAGAPATSPLDEAARLLADVGIAMPALRITSSEAEAVAAADAVGWPVAMKIDHPSVAPQDGARRCPPGGRRTVGAGPTTTVSCRRCSIRSTANPVQGPSSSRRWRRRDSS